ncbi:restriction endonuclease subunit S [Paracoccus sp. DMF]|uniref:restriction endonuclease subunit S n=1 Tax=Paracoccus sp. DMF TaxID=400837 RepID=UPI0011035EA4|nr:restriction endonuclease subunit S [Paracoccus sp. DMF]MCV2448129.1 restriction endonuclease subunit S [Paracoccus sp. DMF]
MSSKEKSSALAGSGAALVPKLRFPEFEERDGWKETPLQKLARPVTDRATTGDADNVLSLSGEHGLVLQSEYFGKKIAGDSTDRYLKIRKDDFVYNDRTTKASSFGTIKRLSAHEVGIVSPIYKCFRFQSSENSAFWEWYFESGSHDPALGGLVNEGARAGRFNISVTQFLSKNAWRPDEDEQQKIADCLDSADALIAAQARKVEALRAHKKGLMQQLFPQEGETQPRLRFPEFEGEWAKSTIGAFKPFVTSGSRGWAAFYADEGELFVRITNLSRESIYIDLRDKKFVQLPGGANEGIRTQLKAADVLISITADIGIIGYVDENVPSPAYINQHIALVRFEDDKLCSKFVAYFLASDQAQRLFQSSTDNGTKAGMNLTTIQNIGLMVPSIREQQLIASCLTSLDDLIAAETRKLDTLKTHKKGLMQQLFPQVGEGDA